MRTTGSVDRAATARGAIIRRTTLSAGSYPMFRRFSDRIPGSAAGRRKARNRPDSRMLEITR
jgi:hypothetical protein